MSAIVKTYVKALPRHQRILFFVDSNINETSLRNIMEANMNVWGGRYNPIVPVQNNNITKEWLRIIQYFDPDFIYYSKNVDQKFLESLNLFYPKEYIQIGDGNRHYVDGISSYCLLHEHVHNFFLTNQTTILRHGGNWDMELKAKSFYQLNLGLRPHYQEEVKWLNNVNTIEIINDNVGEINKYIFQHRPLFTSLLSALHINSVCLDRNRSWNNSRFEWIIYDKNKYLDDLLYFWNRQLYFEPKNLLNQVISTEEEIKDLTSDQWFGLLLKHFSLDNHIALASLSLSQDILGDLQKLLQPKCNNIRIEVRNLPTFPFEPGHVQNIQTNYFKPINNLILGEKDFLKLPDVFFENNKIVDKGPYAIDTVIEKETYDEHKEIKFPYNTELHFILCKEKSRVNKQHRATIFANRDLQSVEFSIPTDIQLIRSVLMYRKVHSKLNTLPVIDIMTSPAGQKLSAFLGLFNYDWSVVKHFLEERFWLQLFRYCSEFKESNIKSGRGIFSYQDIVSEIDKLFEKYKNEIATKIRELPSEELTDELINRAIERNKEDVFSYYINNELNYLIGQSALFVGMKVKCSQCGSNKWYSLTELHDKLPCRGCNSEIVPNLDSKVYYKLSDTLINNLKSDLTKNNGQYNGNYVVIKTLLHLKNDSRHVGTSFHWAPCLDIVGNKEESILATDLDIAAIQNGKLIIGEAKDDAAEFKSKKVKNNLIWAGNNLSPDKLILAYRSGEIGEVIQEIKERLINKQCEVFSYKVSSAWYHLPGIFGLPNGQLHP